MLKFYVGLLVGLQAGANPLLGPCDANRVAAARRAVQHNPAQHAGPAGKSGPKLHVSERRGLPDLHWRPQDLQLRVELVQNYTCFDLSTASIHRPDERVFLFSQHLSVSSGPLCLARGWASTPAL